MILDNNLVWSLNQAITVTARSTYTLDLAVSGMITTAYQDPLTSLSIGNATVFGEDLGIGSHRLELWCNVGTAFDNGATPTLTIAFQGAIDPNNGTGLVSGLTWTTYWVTDTITGSLLTANTRIPLPDWPHRKIAASMPRFIGFNYTVASGPFTTGTIARLAVSSPVQENPVGNYPSGFKVGA